MRWIVNCLSCECLEFIANLFNDFWKQFMIELFVIYKIELLGYSDLSIKINSGRLY